jgi:hypothetical protein
MAHEMHAEEIIDQITGGSSDSGTLANELLRELHHGYPVERLRPLLSSDDSEVAAIAAWISSELVCGTGPILDDLVALLEHPVREVRFYSIDAVMAGATGPDSYRAASVLPMLDDRDPAVRWKAMRFLSYASVRQLQAALDWLRADEPGHPHVPRLQWLLSPDARDPAQVVACLSSPHAELRRYAAAAAVRLLGKDRTALVHASTAEDPEINRFATDMLSQEQTVLPAGRKAADIESDIHHVEIDKTVYEVKGKSTDPDISSRGR